MYRLPQFDIGWQKYADLFRLERNDKDRERDAFDNIPPEIFASKALLAYGIRTDMFDLVPTVRNYEKLIDNVSHTSYHNNNYYYNFHIAVLQTHSSGPPRAEASARAAPRQIPNKFAFALGLHALRRTSPA